MNKTSIIRLLSAAALLAFSSRMAAAQGLCLSLTDCIARAVEHNPDLLVAEAETDKARMLQQTAFDIDMTEFSLSQDPTSGGSPDNAITLSQSFDFPTVYAARRGYLRSQTAEQDAMARLSRLNVERDVAAAYYNLVYRRGVCGILARQDSVYARFLEIASARRKAGATSQLELMNAQRAVDGSRIRLQQAEADCSMAMAELCRLVATDTAIVPADGLLAPISDLSATESVAFEQTAVADVCSAQAETSRKNLRLARQMFLPKFSVGLRSQLVLKSFNPYNVERDAFSKGNFMGFEVGVSVPLFWGSTRAKARAASKDVEIQRLKERNARDIMARDRQNALAELRQAGQTLEYYERQGTAQAAEMARLSQAAYEAGEIGYVEYAGNQAAAIELQLEYAEAINRYNQALIKLKYISK